MQKNTLLLILFGFILIILGGCGSQYEGDFSYDVQPFAFQNQDGEVVTKKELEGKFWVADMIFTNCQTVCSPMTANMAALQAKLKEAGLSEEVRLVSFSIDPERDTAEILKEYVTSRGGTFENWDVLTGYEYQEIKELSIKSFKAYLAKLPDTGQYTHATNFYIVSPEGKAIKAFDGTRHANMDKIVAYIKEII